MTDGCNEGRYQLFVIFSYWNCQYIFTCSLDFDKRDKDLEDSPDAMFDGEKFIQDNIKNAGPNSVKKNDNGFSWVNPSGFGQGHWDYDRS